MKQYLMKLLGRLMNVASFPKGTLACEDCDHTKTDESSLEKEEELGSSTNGSIKDSKPCDWYRCNERYFFGI